MALMFSHQNLNHMKRLTQVMSYVKSISGHICCHSNHIFPLHAGKWTVVKPWLWFLMRYILRTFKCNSRCSSLTFHKAGGPDASHWACLVRPPTGQAGNATAHLKQCTQNHYFLPLVWNSLPFDPSLRSASPLGGRREPSPWSRLPWSHFYGCCAPTSRHRLKNKTQRRLWRCGPIQWNPILKAAPLFPLFHLTPQFQMCEGGRFPSRAQRWWQRPRWTPALPGPQSQEMYTEPHLSPRRPG